MNKYSDKVLFDVELEDEEGVKRQYSGRTRTYSVLEKIVAINAERDAKEDADKKAGKPFNTMHLIEANYKTFALAFSVPLDEAKKYGNETIVSAIHDWRSFYEKKALAQAEPNK